MVLNILLCDNNKSGLRFSKFPLMLFLKWLTQVMSSHLVLPQAGSAVVCIVSTYSLSWCLRKQQAAHITGLELQNYVPRIGTHKCLNWGQDSQSLFFLLKSAFMCGHFCEGELWNSSYLYKESSWYWVTKEKWDSKSLFWDGRNHPSLCGGKRTTVQPNLCCQAYLYGAHSWNELLMSHSSFLSYTDSHKHTLAYIHIKALTRML